MRLPSRHSKEIGPGASTFHTAGSHSGPKWDSCPRLGAPVAERGGQVVERELPWDMGEAGQNGPARQDLGTVWRAGSGDRGGEASLLGSNGSKGHNPFLVAGFRFYCNHAAMPGLPELSTPSPNFDQRGHAQQPRRPIGEEFRSLPRCSPVAARCQRRPNDGL